MEALKKLKETGSRLSDVDFEVMEKFINELDGIDKEDLKLISAGVFLDAKLDKKQQIMKLINIFKGDD